MASKQSEARARVSLDPAPFEKGAKKVIAAAESMSATLRTAFATAGAAVLLAFGANTVSNIASTVDETLKFGEAMANAGKRAQMAAGQFYLFNAATEKGIGLKTAAALIGKNAEVLNRSANTFRDVSIKLWTIGEQIRGFWLGLLERLSPVLSTMLDGTLGNALLDAGNDFGEAIANGVATLYQLAKDGKLWQTLREGFRLAFDYAGERMKWFAGVSYGVLKEVFSLAFVNGVTSAIAKTWKALGSLGEQFGDELGAAIFEVITDVMEMLDGWFKKLDGLIAFLNGGNIAGTQKNADDQHAFLAQKVMERRAANAPKADTTTPVADTMGQIMAAFNKSSPFQMSGGLASQIEAFGTGLQQTFTKFQREQRDNPAMSFENNTRRVATGADSFAALGLGGNVYMGLSVLDVNKSQLKEMRRTNEILMGLKSGGLTSGGLSSASLGPSGLTRTQTASPFQGASPAGAH